VADPGLIDVHAEMREQTRTLKRGVQKRYVVDFQIGDLIVDTRPGPIGDEFAGVIRDLIQKQWKAVTKPAAPETVARRERARRSQQGKAYKKRYTGGRTGHTPPTASVRYGIDSGRTVDGIFLRPRRKSNDQSVVTLNTPANRFKEDGYFDARPVDRAQFQAYLGEMRRLVPLLGGRVDAQTSAEISGALRELQDGLVSVNRARYQALIAKRRAAIVKLFRAGAGAFL